MKKHRINNLQFMFILSWSLAYLTCIALIVYGYSKYVGSSASDTRLDFEVKFGTVAADYMNRAKTAVITGLVSLIPTVVLSIIVKDKIKPTIWMINIILSSILVGEYMMYCTFAMWAIDTYILIPIIAKLKTERIVDNRLRKIGVLKNE